MKKVKQGIEMSFDEFHKFWEGVCFTEILPNDLLKTLKELSPAKYQPRDLIELKEGETELDREYIVLRFSQIESKEYSYFVYNRWKGDYENGVKQLKYKWVKDSEIIGHKLDSVYLKRLKKIHKR